MSLAVVVADQDVRLAKSYSRFLVDHGLSVETATCGLECLGLVRALNPDVLILDCELPWGDAQGVLACLREDSLSLPVVLTTCNASRESVCQLVGPPVVLCLRKFFSLPTLLDGVHFAVTSNRNDVLSDCQTLMLERASLEAPVES